MIDRVAKKMGKTAIRTVCKVDFDKPAAEQPYLHVGSFFFLDVVCVEWI